MLKDHGRGAGIRGAEPRGAGDSPQVFGDEHRETATSKNELAQLLLERGDLAGAEPLFRENVATSQRVLGDDHPNIGAAKANLAQLLIAKGDAAGAEALLRESLAVDGRVFGETHTRIRDQPQRPGQCGRGAGRLRRSGVAARAGGRHRAARSWATSIRASPR